MSAELAFTVLSRFSLVGWLLLAILPNLKLTRILVRSGLWPAILSAAYFLLLATHRGSEGNFQSLAGVAALFSNPWVLLAGWVHYLAFDLLLGIWETKEAESIGLSRWILIPCLFLTLMVGPIGFLIFYVIRIVKGGFNVNL
ncbi:ABA4-like family protein [Leptospira inadai]|uniref:DUF4281 domain-containing protein n=1 Tax=Leptospira inadai serovar Lyme TaxID=293084 RepID=A0ABX4YJG2_9LEPT|nr:ABA4-like family protein [Leptospira inadai]PNV75412.1 DUF4281 domain-containing protein [Leptospira inadai serovar Lyme]